MKKAKLVLSPSWLFPKKIGAIALGKYIFVPKAYWEAIDDHEKKALCIHEQVHIERQNAKGLFRWLVLYFVSRRFRLDEEITAYLKEYAFRTQSSSPNEETIRAIAKSLSTGYFLRINEKDIITRIRQLSQP